MKFGVFLMPAHPPERSLEDGAEWDLQLIKMADEFGFEEAWVGEHHTLPWEPCPAPDLLLAQAIRETSRIKLATGGFVLPYHHPAELSARIGYLDHLAKGRFICGIAASGAPSDWKLFDVDGAGGETRKMLAESLNIMKKLWTSEEPFRYEGEYWTIDRFDNSIRPDEQVHIFPYQKPYPPIGISGLSPNSPTLKFAGEHGLIPLSLGMNDSFVKGHWDAVLEGASKSGRTPKRSDWHVTREVFVADSDEEALDIVSASNIGRFYREYWLPYVADLGMLGFYKQDQSLADEDVTVDYLSRNVWLVGSPETVTRKLKELYDRLGGFGTLLVQTNDFADRPDQWRRSVELIGTVVAPQVADLVPD